MQTAVEQVIEFRFSDRKLLDAACSISARAFGALEFLGDSIADLTVGIACWRAGRNYAEASALVANRHLDIRFRELLEGKVHARSGDVIEALVGAVFLDGGFDAAARVAVRLCAPELEWIPPDAHPERRPPMPRWISPLVIDAALADHDVRAAGVDSTSQHKLDQSRRSRVNRAAVRASATHWLDVRHMTETDPSEWFSDAVATKLVASGWDAAAAFVVDVLTHPSPNRRH